MNTFWRVVTAPVVYPALGIWWVIRGLAICIWFILVWIWRIIVALALGIWWLLCWLSWILWRCIAIPFEVLWAIISWPFKAVSERYSPNKITFDVPKDIWDTITKKK